MTSVALIVPTGKEARPPPTVKQKSGSPVKPHPQTPQQICSHSLAGQQLGLGFLGGSSCR
jgi:hypothetical protein